MGFLHSFGLAFYKGGNYKSENQRCGYSHCRCRQSAGEYSERALRVHSLFYASCNRRTKAYKRNRNSRTEKIKKRVIRPRGIYQNTNSDEKNEYSCRSKLGQIDKKLGENAQNTACEKYKNWRVRHFYPFLESFTF